MSPPDVNLKRQQRRHWPLTWGIVLSVIVGLLAAIAVALWVGDRNEADPATSDTPLAPQAPTGGSQAGGSQPGGSQPGGGQAGGGQAGGG
jgi:uncharacterized membrane protein